MKKALVAVGAVLAIVAGILAPNYTYAFGSQVCQGAGGCEGVSDPGGSVSNLVQKVVSAIFGVVGVLAVLMMILGGIQLMTSAGDPGKVKKGKDTIIWGIIGLVITLFSYAIVSFVLSAVSKAAN